MSDSKKYVEIGQLYAQATNLEKNGHIKDAIKVMLRILDLLDKKADDNLLDKALGLGKLASLYLIQGKKEKAISSYIQSVELFRAAIGTAQISPIYLKLFVRCLLELGSIYENNSQLMEAEPLYVEAIKVTNKFLGEKNNEYAESLYKLALNYRNRGEYPKSERLFLQCIETLKNLYDYEHPDFAKVKNSLGLLYYLIGSLDKAETLYLEALTIWKNSNKENSPKLAACLNNLAILYDDTNRSHLAEGLHLQSLRIRVENLDRNDPEIAESLVNIGLEFNSMGSQELAETVYLKALDIWRNSNNDNSPKLAMCLSNLGSLYNDTGRYKEAEVYCLKALEIERNLLGKKHQLIRGTMQQLIIAYVAQGDINKALQYAIESLHIENLSIPILFSMGSLTERIDFNQNLNSSLSLFLSLVLAYFSNSNSVMADAADLVMKRKGITTEALMEWQRSIVIKNQSLKEGLKELNELNSRISEETLEVTLNALFGKDQVLSQNHLNDLKLEREQIETRLVRSIPELRLKKLLRERMIQRIVTSLPNSSALIEFVLFDYFNFSRPPNPDLKRWLGRHYAAVIITHEDLKIIDLGNADNIDTLVNELRNSVISVPDNRGIKRINLHHAIPMIMSATGARNLVEQNSKTSSKKDSSGGSILSNLVFQPLKSLIKNKKRIFISPDGELNKLPFEILPVTGSRRFLIDDYTVSYLSSGRDLLRFELNKDRTTSEPIIAADPDYNFGRQDQSRQSFEPFEPLSGTKEEAILISKILQTEPLLGSSVLERTIKNCKSPKILHIATHGFFFPNQLSNLQNLNAKDKRLFDNPMVRSGLALAGANTRLSEIRLPEEAEDGLLTAEDVCLMDLSNTELAVLSACETALGDIQVGEGVFGLRRAFMLAGARTLVMSMWKIPDKETVELMTDFYTAAIINKKSKIDALREAQLKMKNKYHDPYYWGAFIMQGNTEPVTSMWGLLPRKVKQIKVGKFVRRMVMDQEESRSENTFKDRN